jgi:hypothetical protein
VLKTTLMKLTRVLSVSRSAWIFGGDPRWILGGCADSFGVVGGLGVGVAV